MFVVFWCFLHRCLHQCLVDITWAQNPPNIPGSKQCDDSVRCLVPLSNCSRRQVPFRRFFEIPSYLRHSLTNRRNHLEIWIVELAKFRLWRCLQRFGCNAVVPLRKIGVVPVDGSMVPVVLRWCCAWEIWGNYKRSGGNVLALFVHVCACLCEALQNLGYAQKILKAWTSCWHVAGRFACLQTIGEFNLFITTIRFCLTLNGFTNVHRIKWQRKDVLQQCSGEAAMSGTVARASREGLSAAPCCLGVALLRLNEAATIEFLRTKREGGREGGRRQRARESERMPEWEAWKDRGSLRSNNECILLHLLPLLGRGCCFYILVFSSAVIKPLPQKQCHV